MVGHLTFGVDYEFVVDIAKIMYLFVCPACPELQGPTFQSTHSHVPFSLPLHGEKHNHNLSRSPHECHCLNPSHVSSEAHLRAPALKTENFSKRIGRFSKKQE